jgi:hypothetical protein
MNSGIEIAAAAERPEDGGSPGFPRRTRHLDETTPAADRATQNRPEQHSSQQHSPTPQFPAHQFPAQWFPAKAEDATAEADLEGIAELEPEVSPQLQQAADDDRERERRTYRGRTVAMLRRYMRYSIETGRLPSLLGREFFRAKVTAYTVVTFEDRVIFVHDMEKCLDRLDEFSRQLIARHVLQEHDRWATAKLLHCNEKTVRRYTPLVLDLLSEILIEVGLMKRLMSVPRNSCQEGKTDPIDVSDCDDGENKV